MKRKRVISLHKCVFGVSVFCLLLPSVALSLRAGAFAGGPAVVAGLLFAGAVLLLLPVGDEYVLPSLYAALALAVLSSAGVLAGLPLRCCLLAVLLVHGFSLLRRGRKRYEQIQPLFRGMAVWYNVEDHARLAYSLALYLLAAAFPAAEAAPWTGWLLLPPSLALYAVLLARVRTGRTCYLAAAREMEIKDLVRGNLRTAPAQAGEKTEELSRMVRLYERVVSLMEQKHPFLDEEFNLDDLASAVYTNRGYLSKTINVLSGRNFNQFVNYFRVRYAAELMKKDPKLRLISVAQMCGFHSSPTFNAAFKVNMGETPSTYLERLRAQKFVK
jgi:AraC-like DNA-binding protein